MTQKITSRIKKLQKLRRVYAKKTDKLYCDGRDVAKILHLHTNQSSCLTKCT